MKSRHRGRQDRRPERPLKPEERAGLHRVALEYRAVLRAETARNGETLITVQAAEPKADGEADRRAHFAAAIARAELGRFYWKAEHSGRKAPQNKKPRSNGARRG